MPPDDTADFDDPDDTDFALSKQFPKPAPAVPTMETDVLEDVFYPDGPPVVVPIQLDKNKYSSRVEAMDRAKYLAVARGLRFVKMFETARYYVAHCYRQNKEA
jgi:hypothetical protein